MPQSDKFDSTESTYTIRQPGQMHVFQAKLYTDLGSPMLLPEISQTSDIFFQNQ